MNLKHSGSLSATSKARLFVAKAAKAANLSKSTRSCILAATAIFSIAINRIHQSYPNEIQHQEEDHEEQHLLPYLLDCKDWKDHASIQ